MMLRRALKKRADGSIVSERPDATPLRRIFVSFRLRLSARRRFLD
jgi:hypothetical protein